MIWNDHIPTELSGLYEVQDYKHAAAILANEFSEEFSQICESLISFRITKKDIVTPGGNESTIPKKHSALLRPLGWVEQNLKLKWLQMESRSIKTRTK